MNAPIMPASTAIQAVVLALSGGGAPPVGSGGTELDGLRRGGHRTLLPCLAGERASDRRQLMRSAAEADLVAAALVSMVG